MSLTTMNTLHDTAPTTTSNLPTERQIKNFDPTALIQTFRLEYEDANQHDHLNVLIEQTAAPEKKKLHFETFAAFAAHPSVFLLSAPGFLLRPFQALMATSEDRHLQSTAARPPDKGWVMNMEKKTDDTKTC